MRVESRGSRESRERRAREEQEKSMRRAEKRREEKRSEEKRREEKRSILCHGRSTHDLRQIADPRLCDFFFAMASDGVDAT